MKQLLILTIAILTANFATAQNNDRIEQIRSEMKRVDQQLKELIADKSCVDENDCASVAYGSKACGGPATYLIYSNAIANERNVNILASQFTALNQEYNILTGAISNCMFVTRPQVGCVANTCQAVIK